MTRQQARDLRNKILADVIRQPVAGVDSPYAGQLQCAPGQLHNQTAGKRLSVGYSVTDGMNYKLELLVYQKSGKAMDVARSIQEAHGGTDMVNISVMNSGQLMKDIEDDIALKRDSFFQPLKKTEPLHIGISISHLDGDAGTLGCFLRHNVDGDDYILSCCHVIANSGNVDLSETNHIFHPACSEVDPVSENRIAVLKVFNELRTSAVNKSDSAIAKINPDKEHTGNVVPKGYGFKDEGKRIFLFKDSDDDESLFELVNNEAYKIGKKTGHTTGVIGVTSMDKIWIAGGRGGKTYLFNNVIFINWSSSNYPFSQAGDSGSLVYTKIDEKLQALGLIFAGAQISDVDQKNKKNVSLVCNIKDILKNYKDFHFI